MLYVGLEVVDTGSISVACVDGDTGNILGIWTEVRMDIPQAFDAVFNKINHQAVMEEIGLPICLCVGSYKHLYGDNRRLIEESRDYSEHYKLLCRHIENYIGLVAFREVETTTILKHLKENVSLYSEDLSKFKINDIAGLCGDAEPGELSAFASVFAFLCEARDEEKQLQAQREKEYQESLQREEREREEQRLKEIADAQVNHSLANILGK